MTSILVRINVKQLENMQLFDKQINKNPNILNSEF